MRQLLALAFLLAGAAILIGAEELSQFELPVYCE